MTDDSTFTGGDIEAAMTAAGGDSPTPSPSPESTPAVSASADTTVPPAAVDAPIEGSPSTTGTPPENRWPSILENQRREAADKAVAEWKQTYGWAEQVNQAELTEAIRIARQSTTDPIAYLQQFANDLQNHPVHGPALKSLHARALQQARQQQAAPSDQEPQVETIAIQLEDGRIVNFPTSESVAKREAWVQRQAVAQAEQKFQPFVQTLQTLQQREQAAQQQAQVLQFTDTTHRDLLTWPGMEDEANQKAVAEALKTIQVNGNDPREVVLALNAAYRSVVLPTLHRTATQSVLTNIRQQAAAGTVNPSQTSTRAPKSMDDMSIEEALRHVASQSV